MAQVSNWVSNRARGKKAECKIETHGLGFNQPGGAPQTFEVTFVRQKQDSGHEYLTVALDREDMAIMRITLEDFFARGPGVKEGT